MTTTKMKELYSSGEWIYISWWAGGLHTWTIRDELPSNIDKIPLKYQKLIHIKHKEVLDHVLSGGRHKVRGSAIPEFTEYDHFIESYNPDNDYKIIPKKQGKNMHDEDSGYGRLRNQSTHEKCPKGCRSVLKHYGTTMTWKCCTCGHTWDDGYVPPKRITREETKENSVGRWIDDVIDELFDYIEYLERINR